MSELLFKSGFEDGVIIDLPILEGELWVQYIKGNDKGYNWLDDFPASWLNANKFRYYGMNRLSNPINYVESRIDQMQGHDGSLTRALYTELKAFDALGTRNEYSSEIKNTASPGWSKLEEGYISYWLKLQPNIVEAMNSTWGWRIFWECFETSTEEYAWVDYVFNLGMRMDADGRTCWSAGGKEKPSPDETYQHIWGESSYVNPPEYIAGRWAFIEIYWKHSIDDGRLKFSVDHDVVIDYYGRNMKDTGLARMGLFKTYVSDSVIANGPQYQWWDDLEIRTGEPEGGESVSIIVKNPKDVDVVVRVVPKSVGRSYTVPANGEASIEIDPDLEDLILPE